MKKMTLCVMLVLVLALLAGTALAADAEPAAQTEALPNLGVTPVVAIVVICYLMAAAIKATALDSKWLPVLCGVCGGILGAVGFLIMPEYPAGDWLTAVAVGIVSGLAATGVNQIGKQLGGNT